MNRSREEMLALAERCEKATGPDRALDTLVQQMAGYTLRDPAANERYQEWRRWVRPDGLETGWLEGSCDYPPRYTASLDAAMTLVPEGWAVRDLSDWTNDPPIAPPHWSVDLIKRRSKYQGQDGQAATAPLALCAAALRAAGIARENDGG